MFSIVSGKTPGYLKKNSRGRYESYPYYYFVGWNSRTDYVDTATSDTLPYTRRTQQVGLCYYRGINIYVFDDLDEAIEEMQNLQPEFRETLSIVELALAEGSRTLCVIAEDVA